MELAERMLLPSLIKQTGKLHLITRFKLDLFAISCANVNRNFALSLTEGFRPSCKRANEVISMLCSTMLEMKTKIMDSFPKNLILHADNYAGQSKNRFTVCFCTCLVLVSLFEEFDPCFLVACHTRNECVGHVICTKRRSRK